MTDSTVAVVIPAYKAEGFIEEMEPGAELGELPTEAAPAEGEENAEG